VVKVTWHKAASPTQTDGSVVFARWRQWAHPSPQPKRHLDRFSRFCTDVPILYNGTPLSPQTCPFPSGSGPSLIHDFLAHPSPQPKRHLDWFNRFCRAIVWLDRPTNIHTDRGQTGRKPLRWMSPLWRRGKINRYAPLEKNSFSITVGPFQVKGSE